MSLSVTRGALELRALLWARGPPLFGGSFEAAMTEMLARLREALSERYAIKREIGRGGMATVYLARDIRHDRDVALKALHPELTTAIGTGRFLREIRTTAQLTHPHILPMHDSGEAGGVLYYTMPYVDGESLRDRLTRDRRLRVEHAVATAVQIADALAYAHARGVVHRDIKPENILFSEAGHVWVADFGLARALHSAASDVLTATGLAVGSPRYMSPEQAVGEHNVDGRSDTYSLACVTYEMLTGLPPFRGSNLQELIAQHVTQSPPLAATIRPEVPEHVSAAIAKAMAKDRVERFGSVGEFAAALDPSGRAIFYRRALALRTPRWVTDRRAVAAGTTVTIAAAIAAAWAFAAPAPRLDPNLVVIGAFENRTGDRNLDPIGWMAADWIGEGVSAARLLRVVPTATAVQAAKFVNTSRGATRQDPIARLASETGAGVVVSGTYNLDKGQLTFHAQVSHVANPPWRLPWASSSARVKATTGSITTPADSVTVAVAKVRNRVMGLLAVSESDELAREALELEPPTYEAYRRFAQGMDAYVGNDFATAARAFVDAYALDSTFTASLLYAGVNYSNMGQYAKEDSLLTIVARSDARLSAYHRHWLAYRLAFLAGDNARALRAIRSAAAEAPRSKAVYNLAVMALETGHLDEAARVLESLSPQRRSVRGFIGYWAARVDVQHLRGDYHDVLQIARDARQAHPDTWWPVGWELGALAALGKPDEVMRGVADLADASVDGTGRSPTEALRETAEELKAHGYRAHADSVWGVILAWYRSAERVRPLTDADRLAIAQTLYFLRQYEAADTLAGEIRKARPKDPLVLRLLGAIAARKGEPDRARQFMQALERLDEPYLYGEPAYGQAIIAAALGENQQALGFLRKARRQGFTYSMWVHREVHLEVMRAMPEYRAFVRPIPMSAGG